MSDYENPINNHVSDRDAEANRAKGIRAEEVAEWYFRLNGFFLIRGFIVHPDKARDKGALTEADLLGIRLRHSAERYWKFEHNKNKSSNMPDDTLLIDINKNSCKHLAVMVEVKSGLCAINGPWTHDSGLDNKSQSNMGRALMRMGHIPPGEIKDGASEMHQHLRYESEKFVTQYIAIGKHINPDLQGRYPHLIQITFGNIGSFLYTRFINFPNKRPLDRNISLWDGFGGEFCEWFQDESAYRRREVREASCQEMVHQYIASGTRN